MGKEMCWEYKKFEGMEIESLNQLGKEGWEVACFITMLNKPGYYLLKRQYRKGRIGGEDN